MLEEIVEDLNSRLRSSILYATVLGTMTVARLLDNRPAFGLPRIGVPTWRGYLLTAALAALVGVLFRKWALGCARRFGGDRRSGSCQRGCGQPWRGRGVGH